MKIVFYTVAVALIFLVSCTSVSEPDMKVQQGAENSDPNLVSVDQALEYANESFNRFYGSGTRTSRKVKDVETFRHAQATRSDDGSTMYGFYIINYDDEGGFVLASADKRRAPIYAVSDKGSLHLSDTVENKGLSWYINEHINNPEAFSVNSANPLDTIVHGFTGPVSFTWLNVEPLMPAIMRTFHQNWPFNALCRTESGNVAMVGCVPLSVGMIMGYYQHPASLETGIFDWATMMTSQNDIRWATLFEILGRKDYLAVEYGTNVTNCSMTGMSATFTKAGYAAPQTSGSFSTNTVNSQLRGDNPVICYGNGVQNSMLNTWIIDGCRIIAHGECEDGLMKPSWRMESFYHCIWGDSNSGFYLYSYNDVIGDVGMYANTPVDIVYSDLGTWHGFKVAQ